MILFAYKESCSRTWCICLDRVGSTHADPIQGLTTLLQCFDLLLHVCQFVGRFCTFVKDFGTYLRTHYIPDIRVAGSKIFGGKVVLHTLDDVHHWLVIEVRQRFRYRRVLICGFDDRGESKFCPDTNACVRCQLRELEEVSGKLKFRGVDLIGNRGSRAATHCAGEGTWLV